MISALRSCRADAARTLLPVHHRAGVRIERDGGIARVLPRHDAALQCAVTGTPASMHFATAMAERLPEPQCSTTGRPPTGSARGSKLDSGNSSAPWIRSVTYSCGSRTSISTMCVAAQRVVHLGRRHFLQMGLGRASSAPVRRTAVSIRRCCPPAVNAGQRRRIDLGQCAGRGTSREGSARSGVHHGFLPERGTTRLVVR